MARMANDKAVSSLRVPTKTMAKVLESFIAGKPDYDFANNGAQTEQANKLDNIPKSY